MRLGRGTKYDTLMLYLFYVLAGFSIYVNQNNSIYGTFVFVFMAMLSISKKFVYTLPVIFVANDALGTAVLGNVSFYWAALVLVIVHKLFYQSSRISRPAGILAAVGMLYCFQLWVVQYSWEIREPLRTLMFICLAVFLVDELSKKRADYQEVFKYFGISVFLVAIHMALTGGIDYSVYGYEGSGGSWIRTSRFGLLGTGIGDPNFSSMRLLFGAVCLFCSDIKRVIKYPMILLLIYCIARTVSLTGVIMLVGMIGVIIFLKQGIARKIKIISTVLVSVSFGIFLLNYLPLGDLNEQMDLLRYRVENSVSSFLADDMNSLTSGRAGATTDNLNYALGRGNLGLLFGGEAIPAPGTNLSHNTYVDCLVRYGLIGLAAIVWLMVSRLISAYKIHLKRNSQVTANVVAIKVLYLAYCFTLSIYNGPDLALISMFMFVM